MSTIGRPTLVAGIASIPGRSGSLRLAIESIWRQVDHVEVVLNDYDTVPDWLRDGRVTVTRSQDVGDHADNAKFLGLGRHADCVYFAIDDDILYPDDYVTRTLACMARYGWRAAVGVHGAFIPADSRGFLDRRTSCFWAAQPADAPCSYVGTGTIAITRTMLPASPLSLFTDVGMSDLFVARWLKERRVPVVCIARPREWLRKIPNPEQPSLWQQARSDCARHDRLLAAAAPWGVSDLLGRCREGIWEELPGEARVALELAADRERGGDVAGAKSPLPAADAATVAALVRFYAGPGADVPPTPA